MFFKLSKLSSFFVFGLPFLVNFNKGLFLLQRTEKCVSVNLTYLFLFKDKTLDVFS